MAQEAWHREESARLSRERAAHEAKQDLFRANDACKEINEAWEAIVNLVSDGDKLSKQLHDAVGQIHAIKGDIGNHMTRGVVPEVAQIMITSHFPKFRSTSLLEMVHCLVSFSHPKNPFYLPSRVANQNGYGGIHR